MNIQDKFKTAVGWTRYTIINALFVGCIYFGLFEGHDGAANVALFLGWFTVAAAIFIMTIRAIAAYAGVSDAFNEQMSRMEPSVIPFWFDAIFDTLIVLAFVYTSYQVLAVFYVFSIFTGKLIRDIPKDLVLKKLKSQQS